MARAYNSDRRHTIDSRLGLSYRFFDKKEPFRERLIKLILLFDKIIKLSGKAVYAHRIKPMQIPTANTLESFKRMTTVVADTGDFETLGALAASVCSSRSPQLGRAFAQQRSSRKKAFAAT